MRELEDMSYKDALTGFGNRFAINRYISQIDHKKSMGVVYCDITGLKHVNDTMGHKAGDQLILRARDCLSKAFGDYGWIYYCRNQRSACMPIKQSIIERMELNAEAVKHSHTILYKRKAYLHFQLTCTF